MEQPPPPPPPLPQLQQNFNQEEHGMEEEETETVEMVLFHVNECYVYMIPPRKSTASYRADEWNVNKWAWEGSLKVASKGEECIIKLEDKKTGELYAQAFLREGEQHPVESVIDSSRYFVLRIEEKIDGRLRHAFIGIGFRERTQAYDFQASLHDHMKYLDKKKTAEEMEQQFKTTSSVDYSLKEGETLVLQIKNKPARGSTKSAFFRQGLNNLPLEEKNCTAKQGTISLKPPPPPPTVVSPTTATSPQGSHFTGEQPQSCHVKNSSENVDDDFGDFQVAG